MHLLDRTILLTLAGSRAHGTATPTSDVDVTGVATPTKAQLLGMFDTFEQVDDPSALEAFRSDLTPDEQRLASATKLEGTIFALHKFLALAATANPNILEVLWVRDAEVRRVTALGERLRAHRDLFVSARCRHTFAGYAANQLGRIRLHYRWHHDRVTGPPDRADFGLPEQGRLPREQVDAAEAAVRKQIDTWELDLSDLEPATRIDLQTRIARTLAEWNLASDDARWTAAARWVGLHDNLIEVLQREREWRAARNEWKRYRTWLDQRNPARAALEAAHGYDTKHGAHLVRLLRMGLEVLQTGQVHVWRGDRDADELRAIRAGAWSYEQLCAWADDARKRLDEATTELPTSPDRAAISALAIELTERALGE